MRRVTSLLLILALSGSSASLAEEPTLDCPAGTELQGDPPPRGEKLWCARPDGVQEGPSLAFYPGGHRHVLAHFRDGRLDGLYREWHANEQLAQEGHYRDDRKEGVFVSFYPDGTKKSEEEWHGGVPDGRFLAWHPNGQKMMEAHYHQGKRDGPARTWYESGQLQTQGQFADGEFDGTWTGWWPNGKKKKVAKFDHGRELSRDYFPEK